MKINKGGIAEASRMEMLAIYIYDEHLFKLMAFGEFVIRCRNLGVKVHG